MVKTRRGVVEGVKTLFTSIKLSFKNNNKVSKQTNFIILIQNTNNC